MFTYLRYIAYLVLGYYAFAIQNSHADVIVEIYGKSYITKSVPVVPQENMNDESDEEDTSHNDSDNTEESTDDNQDMATAADTDNTDTKKTDETPVKKADSAKNKKSSAENKSFLGKIIDEIKK